MGRFLKNPLRYVSAIGYWRLLYPLRKQGCFAHARTFFDTDMEVVLPSATEIFLFGAKTHDSEIRLARFLIKSLRPDDTFCDVGAHFGYFSLLASQLTGPGGRVIAFEASHSTFSVLKRNTAQAANLTALHLAASDENKSLVFYEFPALFSEYNSLVLPEARNATWLKGNAPQRNEVQGQRLDDFFEKGKHIPRFIKIDVEGAEPQVLRGVSQFLKKNTPVIAMEYLRGSEQSKAHQEALEIVRALGYKVFRIKKDGSLESCEDVEAAMQQAGLDSDNLVMQV